MSKSGALASISDDTFNSALVEEKELLPSVLSHYKLLKCASGRRLNLVVIRCLTERH